MLVRGIVIAGVAGLALIAAIIFWPENPRYQSTPPEVQVYPVRSDWLVVNAPSGKQPSRTYQNGFPPLVLLKRPFETVTGDAALLVPEVRKRMILDTSAVDAELRDEFGNVLTELFGSPLNPKVPDGKMLIHHLQLEDKLGSLRKSLATKRAEIAAASAGAKMPDRLQLVDSLESQSIGIANDVRDLENRLDHLRCYVDELKLDGNTLKQGRVVFRNLCQICHGPAGGGNGSSARYQTTLPRDYRQGVFKFITTDPSVNGKRKPSREDLHRTIYYGTEEASPMPNFSSVIKEADLQAVISYVIHLSIRGETEYEVMKRVADPGADEISRADLRQRLFEQAAAIAPLWIASGRRPIVPDPNPYTTEDQILDSAVRGHALFNSPQVGCMACHAGYGKTALYWFDSWASIVRPRDLTQPSFCEGRHPAQIYACIYGGIPGSNMPSYTHLRPSMEDRANGIDKIWDLVHFVLYLSDNEKRQILEEKKQINIEMGP